MGQSGSCQEPKKGGSPREKKATAAEQKKPVEDEKKPHAAPTAASPARKGLWVLPGPTPNVEDEYKFEAQIGQPGAFGVAKRATNKKTGKKVAIKCINKARFKSEALPALRAEVDIMKQLKPHPNVIEFLGAYEDASTLFIVLELCEGGELFDRILNRGHYSEKDAAAVFRQIVAALAHLHEYNIAHCDIKPDNFLFLTKAEDSVLKIIDFGMSKREQFREYHHDTCGTPYYVAPEVLKGKYNKACDMWSIGVVMFIMLYGFPPFHADPESPVPQDEQIFRQVEKGFSPLEKAGYGPWFPKAIKVSESAKDLMKRMLCMDVADRPTADEVLAHPWVRGEAALDTPLDRVVLKSLKDFDASSKFAQAILFYMADSLSDVALKAIEENFKKMDKNGDGFITAEELEEALHNGSEEDKKIAEDVDKIMKKVDLDKDGRICYEELLLAAVHRQLISKHERLRRAFNEIDIDGNGKLDEKELQEVLSRSQVKLPNADSKTLIKEADLNGDGMIDFEEFIAVFSKGDKQYQKVVAKTKLGVSKAAAPAAPAPK